MLNLTAREMDAWELVAEGLSNKLIADRLGISDHTAKFHVANLMKKLRADNRAKAAVLHERWRITGDVADVVTAPRSHATTEQ